MLGVLGFQIKIVTSVLKAIKIVSILIGTVR